MKSTKILVLTVSALLLFSCAKDRPIDTDGTSGAEKSSIQTRLSKGTFNQNTLWYSKATIVKRSDTTPKQWMFVGSAGSMQVGYFEFSKEKLSFYDAISTNDKDTKITSDDLLYAWDISHSQYSLKESNGEVKNVEMEDPNLEWNEKNFFKVNFANGNVSPRSDIGTTASSCWSQKSAELVPDSLQVSGEHVAFNVQYVYEYKRWFSWNCNTLTDLLQSSPTYTVQIRYSFKPRANVMSSDYAPYVYDGENDPLMKKYGYFKTRVYSKDEHGRLRITWLMNRWNPNRDLVTYYFDEGTPEELKEFYTNKEHGIAKKTNDILEASGAKIRFEFKDYDGSVCKFGDVGCSFVKINTEPHNRAPLGYGPSDADPLTGEIVSGRTMIWPDSMKRSIKFYLSAMEEYKEIAPETSTVYKVMKERLNDQDVAHWTHTAEPLKDFTGENKDIANAYRFLLPQYTYASKNYNWTTFAHTPAERTYVDELEEMQEFIDHLRDENIVSNDMFANLEETFQGELEIAKLQQEDDEIENSFLKVGQYTGCKGLTEESMAAPVAAMAVHGKSAEDIFNTMFYMVAIHEFGHTINLEHNFYGSLDLMNLDPEEPAISIDGSPVYVRNEDGSYKLDENGERIQATSKSSTTSVMEYLDRSEEYDEIHDWGPYDKAAISYAYTSGSLDLAKEKGTDYLFCTHDSSNYMAMCNTWDTGSTPSEVAFSIIDGYEARYPYVNYRYDRAIWDTSYTYGRAWGIMWKLKTFMKMQKATFQLGDMQQKLVLKNYETPVVDIYNAVQADMKQAVKLSLAFYDAMIHQKDADRNFRDTVNEEYGTVEKLGIWPEKMYAMLMLYNNHYIGYNPNEGWVLTSYLSYLDESDEELSSMLMEILDRGLTERIDEYADVDLFRIMMYINSTVDSAGTMGEGELPNVDLAGVLCYRPSTFVDTFGESLAYEDAQIFELDAANLPEYYQRALGADGKVNVAALRQNNKVYVASEQQNPFTYKMIKEAVDVSDTYKLLYVRRGARKMKTTSMWYNLAVGDQAQYCR